MHNLISYNQMAEWNHVGEGFDESNRNLDLVNDYFNCMIECDDSQSTCKRICREILLDS